MSDAEFHEESARPTRRQDSAQGGVESGKSNVFHSQSMFTAAVLREIFNLLEQHAPVWYTEQHHDRAVVALRILDED